MEITSEIEKSMEIIHRCNYEPCQNSVSTIGPGSMKVCKSCKLVRYCDKECQSKDWSIHRSMCKDINTCKESGITFNKKKYIKSFITRRVFPEFYSRRAFNIIDSKHKMKRMLFLCSIGNKNNSVITIKKKHSDALKLYLRSKKIEMKRNFRILLMRIPRNRKYFGPGYDTIEDILSVVEINYNEDGIVQYKHNVFITFPYIS